MNQVPFETDARDVSPYLQMPLRTLDEVLRERALDRGGAECEPPDQSSPQGHPRRRG